MGRSTLLPSHLGVPLSALVFALSLAAAPVSAQEDDEYEEDEYEEDEYEEDDVYEDDEEMAPEFDQNGAPIERDRQQSVFVVGGVDLLRPTSIRVGAVYAWEHSAADGDGFRSMSMLGLGPRVELHLPPDGSAPAWGLGLMGRFSGVGTGVPIGLEGGLSWLGDGTDGAAVAAVGAYMSLYYVDVGYLLQVPVAGDGPDWLGQHGVSMRVAAPVWRRGR